MLFKNGKKRKEELEIAFKKSEKKERRTRKCFKKVFYWLWVLGLLHDLLSCFLYLIVTIVLQ